MGQWTGIVVVWGGEGGASWFFTGFVVSQASVKVRNLNSSLSGASICLALLSGGGSGTCFTSGKHTGCLSFTLLLLSVFPFLLLALIKKKKIVAPLCNT